jgi:D-aminoacyl-tRNA deacylase
MRVFIQRVSEASVTIAGNVVGSITQGYCILLGIESADNQEDIEWLCSDEVGKMNQSIVEVDGDVLLISQFTLHAATKKGNRPSFIKAAKPDTAIPLYETFKQQLTLQLGKAIATGQFGADMKVALINDGPVSIWIDSKNRE